jgi:hypothetical protein
MTSELMLHTLPFEQSLLSAQTSMQNPIVEVTLLELNEYVVQPMPVAQSLSELQTTEHAPAGDKQMFSRHWFGAVHAAPIIPTAVVFGKAQCGVKILFASRRSLQTRTPSVQPVAFPLVNDVLWQSWLAAH